MEMVLQTKRLTIRFIEAEDWKSLIEIWDDFSRSKYAEYDMPHPQGEGEVREKAAHWALVSPEKEHMFFAVCRGEKMIGCVDFHKRADGYECGYCFHSSYHGMGYAKESIRALTQWLAEGKRTRFIAGTALKNLPSVRLLRFLGFRKEGEEQVSFYTDKNGNAIYFVGGIFGLDVEG